MINLRFNLRYAIQFGTEETTIRRINRTLLKDERNHDLPVARVLISKLLFVLPMFLHGPLCHRA